MTTEVTGCAACKEPCCSPLSGLRLNDKEYQTHFAQFEEKVEVQSFGCVRMIAIDDGCPHFNPSVGCTDYENRSMECRLFPHTMNHVIAFKNSVFITVHTRTVCNHKPEVMIPDEEALRLVKDWAHQTYPGRKVTVRLENGIIFYLAQGLRVFRKLDKLFFNKRVFA